MSVCAVVRNEDNVVINKIIAEPTDLPQDGCYLVLIPEGSMCDMGWVWDGSNFVDPNASAAE
jgi:hypothetical protein